MSSFLEILKERFRHISSLLQMDLARASLVLIRVLRTLIDSIAKNLHKLQICLRFYSFHKKLDIQAIYFEFTCGKQIPSNKKCAIIQTEI